jgi:O-antigen/teichoic acid export membrane protein
VVITTHLWGAAGRGEIAILIANLSLITIISNILSGSSVMYYTPRTGFTNLWMPALSWIITVTAGSAVFLYLTGAEKNLIFLFFLVLYNSLFMINTSYFLGKEKIGSFNLFNILVTAGILVFTLFFHFVAEIHNVQAYYTGYITALMLAWGISSVIIFRTVINERLKWSLKIFIQLFRYGWQNELSSFLQFLNDRLALYFLSYFLGMKSVGLFSIGIAISESVWVFSRSIAMVQYSKLINMEDMAKSRTITNRLAVLSLTITVVAAGILLLLPKEIYGFVFGKEFIGLKPYIAVLVPGILAISFSTIQAHYFAATNQLVHLIIKSGIGLLLTVVLSVLLIPRYGISGACLVSSLSAITTSGYILVMYKKNLHRHTAHAG